MHNELTTTIGDSEYLDVILDYLKEVEYYRNESIRFVAGVAGLCFINYIVYKACSKKEEI